MYVTESQSVVQMAGDPGRVNTSMKNDMVNSNHTSSCECDGLVGPLTLGSVAELRRDARLLRARNGKPLVIAVLVAAVTVSLLSTLESLWFSSYATAVIDEHHNDILEEIGEGESYLSWGPPRTVGDDLSAFLISSTVIGSLAGLILANCSKRRL